MKTTWVLTDEERKQKQAAVNGKKKLETDYKDLESTMDMNNKVKKWKEVDTEIKGFRS